MSRLAPAVLLALSLTTGLCVSSAIAADASAPVKAVMDETVSNWAGGDSEWQDIFDDRKLDKVYSKDLAEKYRAAAKFPAVDDDGISPFDYDVIVGGQDACPLEDVSITPQASVNGTTEVVARFKKSSCMGPDADYQAYTSVRFEVIEEGGNAVIDDILTVGEDGKTNSLKAAILDIVKQQ